jgi:glycerol-3-phosphate dehydrogenase
VQARAIAETGHNPRYLQSADLRGITATTIDEAPIADAELVVLAVPSRAFADVAAALPGDAPVLSLTKGPSSRARTWPRKSQTASLPRR